MTMHAVAVCLTVCSGILGSCREEAGKVQVWLAVQVAHVVHHLHAARQVASANKSRTFATPKCV